MPAAVQQSDSYGENQAQLEKARVASAGSPNEESANTPEYEPTESSSAPQERVNFASFVPAFLTALLKDLLDFAFITSIFGIGTILTGCFVILIVLFILFFPKQRYHTIGNVSLALKEMSLLLGLAVFEGLAFPINLLPATAGIVYAIYRLEKKAVDERNATKKTGLATNIIDFARRRQQMAQRKTNAPTTPEGSTSGAPASNTSNVVQLPNYQNKQADSPQRDSQSTPANTTSPNNVVSMDQYRNRTGAEK